MPERWRGVDGATEHALKCWTRYSGSRVRPPLPRALLCALVGVFLDFGLKTTAVALCLAFGTYLRPGELFALEQRHLVPSFPTAGWFSWSVLFAKREDGLPTKGNNFDEAIEVDGQWGLWLGRVLEILHRRRKPRQSLWAPHTSADMIRHLWTAAASLHLGQMDIQWHMARHRGASHYAAMGLRSLETIQNRLRHSSLNTVRRYKKAGNIVAKL